MNKLVKLFALLMIFALGQAPAPAAALGNCGLQCEYLAGCADEGQCDGIIVCSSFEDGCENCDWAPRCVEDLGSECDERILCTPDQT